ncbi:inositol monophosphatase family protein [Actinosynnema pretiosum]|uniref:3'(2'),5'-bisphosphate nucleotidase CysQ n=1 Tax=Actinosynnema pretiosum TaxID=42197 RepID=A0A290ZH38_9PSEU|nr:inositol monophosphatase family protein [Actinosynnema pretiosum]ATE58294.1 3'(2'),5'-bisphosphate nucleotidase CysQ [Actinosynnema pretiosum]
MSTLTATATATADAVRAAGTALVRGYRTSHDLVDRAAVEAAIAAADEVSLAELRPALEAAAPDAGWVEDELAEGGLPPGRWWVVDPVEGAINYVHGLPEWGVTATLVEDDLPVLTAVHLPLADLTYTATAGGGALRNGERLRASVKAELRGALVGTGQASPGETEGTWRLIGRSATAMMAASGVLGVSVPPTLRLLHVADGRSDVFWQHGAVRSGLLPGALLVAEAGGVVSDLRGAPWTAASGDFLAAAPGVHAQAAAVLGAL